MDPQPDRPTAARKAEALRDLLGEHRGRLLRQARRHADSDEDAQDALGDAAVQFLRRYEGPPGRDALYWMLHVVKRCANEIRRRQSETRLKPRPLTSGDTAVEDLPADGPGPAEAAERAEELLTFVTYLDQLKPDERTALVLVGGGFPYQEIADTQGWTLTKVRRCVYEGRVRLRELQAKGGNP